MCQTDSELQSTEAFCLNDSFIQYSCKGKLNQTEMTNSDDQVDKYMILISQTRSINDNICIKIYIQGQYIQLLRSFKHVKMKQKHQTISNATSSRIVEEQSMVGYSKEQLEIRKHLSHNIVQEKSTFIQNEFIV